MPRSPTPQALAVRLLTTADALRAASQPREAARELEQALRFEGALGRTRVAQIRLRIADCLDELDDHPAALAALEPLLARPVDDVWLARTHLRVARARYLLGDVESALRFAEDSARVLATTSHHAETAKALQWLAHTLKDLGRADEALEIDRDALAVARLSGDRVRIASCLASLGTTYHRRSSYTVAFNLMKQGLALSREVGDASHVLTGLVNLGSCALHLGRWAEARQYLEEAHRMARVSGNKRSLANVALALCRLRHRMGEDVRECLAEATARADESGFRRCRLVALEVECEIAMDRGDFAYAQERGDLLLRLARPDVPGGDFSYEVELLLARLALHDGRRAEAESAAQVAMEAAEAAGDARVAAGCLVTLARVHAESGETGLAVSELRRAVHELRGLEAPYDLARAHADAEKIVPEKHRPEHRREAARLFESLGAVGRIEAAAGASTGTPVRGRATG